MGYSIYTTKRFDKSLNDTELVLLLIDTGTHSDLFD